MARWQQWYAVSLAGTLWISALFLQTGWLQAAHLPDDGDIAARIYARVIYTPCPVFNSPCEEAGRCTPARFLTGDFVWVSLERPDPVDAGGQLWYLINPGEYVQAEYLVVRPVSQFKGIEINDDQFFPFAWVIMDAYVTHTPGSYFDPSDKPISKYTIVRILQAKKVGRWNWYRIADDRWIEQRMVAMVQPRPRPPGIGPAEKWIYADLYEQTICAYEGDKMVYATLISSGVRDYETVQGQYRIWIKARSAKMSGGEKEGTIYFLEDVPYQMYFLNNYAIHGVYWHDRFGTRQSHGCLNVSLNDARWFFYWTHPVPSGNSNWTKATSTDPGTWVVVH